jgi:hypothetical protein
MHDRYLPVLLLVIPYPRVVARRDQLPALHLRAVADQ